MTEGDSAAPSSSAHRKKVHLHVGAYFHSGFPLAPFRWAFLLRAATFTNGRSIYWIHYIDRDPDSGCRVQDSFVAAFSNAVWQTLKRLGAVVH